MSKVREGMILRSEDFGHVEYVAVARHIGNNFFRAISFKDGYIYESFADQEGNINSTRNWTRYYTVRDLNK